MAVDFLNYLRVFDESNHPHLLLTRGTLQRVHMPGLANQVAPFPGR